MREPHKKGVAHHFGSESCAWVRKDAGEALTGVHTGQVWSSKSPLRCADRVLIRGRQHEGRRQARAVLRHRGVRDPRHVGNSMRENREALQTPTLDGGAGRSKKAKSRNVDMHVCGESDDLIVPTKRANKADAYALVAESAEERGSTKGNAPQAHSRRTQSRGCESQGLWRVRQAARRDRRRRLILHPIQRAAGRHMNPR